MVSEIQVTITFFSSKQRKYSPIRLKPGCPSSNKYYKYGKSYETSSEIGDIVKSSEFSPKDLTLNINHSSLLD